MPVSTATSRQTPHIAHPSSPAPSALPPGTQMLKDDSGMSADPTGRNHHDSFEPAGRNHHDGPGGTRAPTLAPDGRNHHDGPGDTLAPAPRA